VAAAPFAEAVSLTGMGFGAALIALVVINIRFPRDDAAGVPRTSRVDASETAFSCARPNSRSRERFPPRPARQRAQVTPPMRPAHDPGPAKCLVPAFAPAPCRELQST